MKIAVLGGGNMGGAIAAGAIAAKIAEAKDVTISHARPALLERLEKTGAEANITSDNKEAVNGADLILIAVKPWLAESVAREIAPVIDPSYQAVASVVAGVDFKTLQEWLTIPGGKTPALFRVIPNTAVSLGQSATFICSHNASRQQNEMTLSVFRPLGKVFEVDEKDMTAVTALASCGIAYILKYIDASFKGGQEIGIDAKQSLEIVIQTVKGALALLEANGSLPQEEIDKVTTPGGITLKGLAEMERCGFSDAVISGLKASK